MAGLLLAVLPAPGVLIGGEPADDGICAWSDMPLSLSLSPIAYPSDRA